MKRWWIFLLLFCSFFLSHCGTGVVAPSGEDPSLKPGEEATQIDAVGVSPACELGTIGYPVMDRSAYTHIYNRRGFYTDGNHLGLDLGYPEGTPIYPIGPGIIRVYRPATGYGTLAIVIEHCSRLGFEARNGVGTIVHGQRFLTIYGHLRRTSGYNTGRTLNWQVGDRVTPYDVIGYIQRDSDNGDGAEHVHLGVRFQTMADAIANDPRACFRGYDGSPSQRRWFADPAEFYAELASQIRLLDDPDAYTETPFPRPTTPRDAGRVTDAAVTTDILLVTADASTPPPDVRLVSPDVMMTSPPPPTDAGSPPVDIPMVHDVASVPTIRRESCNGVDDDGDGLIDEDFLCALGRQVDVCATSCGSVGYFLCEAPSCVPGMVCRSFPESCANGADEDCDGLRDCADPDCASAPACIPRDAGMMTPDIVTPSPIDAGSPIIDVYAPPSIDVSLAPSDVPSVIDVAMALPDAPRSPVDMGSASGSVIRYEFRVLDSAGWEATAPFRLRDRWWAMSRCNNTGTTFMETRADGWYRCDLSVRLTPFVGSFYSPLHPDWGDRGNLGTVGNSPDRCTPTDGVEWRITDLVSGLSIFTGTSAELPCVAEGSQDRHRLP
jgi:hypothetical protein